MLPTLQITGAWLQRDTIKVKYSAQEHNTMTWPGLIPRPLTQTSRQGFQCTDCKAKIFVTSSLKEEHMMFFFSYNNCVEPFQISMAWLSSLGARKNFRQLLNCQILLFAGIDLSDNVNQENSTSL